MGKLDTSLDEIINKELEHKTRRRSGKNHKAAPAGGVQKQTRRTPVHKPANNKAAPANPESSIVVSNLPYDVVESQIKDYFDESISRVKSVEISYGPDGSSRGKANVTFFRPEGASKAFTKLNGIHVDNRPIDIKIVVGKDKAASLIEEPKSLFERASGPKSQPRSAASDRRVSGAKGKADSNRGGRRRPRSSRPVKKSVDQLDSEMADYFDASAGHENAEASHQLASNGDAPMEDEIS